MGAEAGDEEAERKIMSEEFTPEAKTRWAAIPAEHQSLLLKNVWCSTCGDVTTIVEFQGRVKQGHLVLEGRCETCGSSVGRLIERA